MFPFDKAQLPKVFARKAFIGVDFQNDFTAESGALRATEPNGYVERAVKVAETFRACGNTVIWTKSCHGAQPVPVDDRILASDSVTAFPARGRRRAPEPDTVSNTPPDEEAFLSHADPFCLKPDSDGSELAAKVKGVQTAGDITIANPDYSAFKDTPLLRLLRSKMVMEVFICGSLINIGVYATAIEAAGHGMAITIIEDCCGYRSEGRQTIAFSRLSHLTGCDIMTAKEVCETLEPTARKSAPSLKPAPRNRKAEAALEVAEKEPQVQSDDTSDLSDLLSDLQLKPNSSKLAAHQGKAAALPTSEASNTTKGRPSKSETSKSKSAENPLVRHTRDSVNKPEADGDVKTEASIEHRLPDREKEVGSSAAIEVDDPHTGDSSNETPEQQKGLCAGDTDIIEDLLPQDLEKDVFETLRTEVKWQRMSHQGGEVPRLVAVQGEVGEDGSMPVYRHPSDESPPLLPFTPTVRAIKAETERHLGHPLNHVLIQFYRDGNDYISEHSDKTIDVVKDSYIANVSLGAQRTMVLRTKRKDKDPSTSVPGQVQSLSQDNTNESKTRANIAQSTAPLQSAETGSKLSDAKEESRPLKKTDSGESAQKDDVVSTKRQVQRATLRHNSLCRMGLQTNMQWLHSIRQDKRAERDKSDAELAFGGGRISLTFRRIGTFLNREETMIWGQGATGKTKDEAHTVINGESPEMVALLKAFGRENHSSNFDWDAHYGDGFDVLHMSNAPRLFASRDALINMRITLMLAEYGISYAKGSMTASKTCNLDDDQLEAASIKYVDSDAAKSVVQGDMAIMLYLHESYGPSTEKASSKSDQARTFTLFQKALTFLTRWRRVQLSTPGKAPDLKLLKEELAFWDQTANAASSHKDKDDDEKSPLLLSGTAAAPGLPDFALWPVLNDLVRVCGKDSLGEYEHLKGWFELFGNRNAVKSGVSNTAQAKISGKGPEEGA